METVDVVGSSLHTVGTAGQLIRTDPVQKCHEVLISSLSQVNNGKIEVGKCPQFSLLAGPEGTVELRLRGLHAVHGHGVQAEQGVELGPVLAHQPGVAPRQQLGQDPQLGDGLGLVSHDQPALDHVLSQHHLEGGEDGGVGVAPHLGDLDHGLVRVPLGLLHEACHHAVHHGDEVDQDTEVLLGHPDELVRRAAASRHLTVIRPLRGGDGLHHNNLRI